MGDEGPTCNWNQGFVMGTPHCEFIKGKIGPLSWEMACTLAPLLVNEDPFWKMWCPTGLEDWGCTDGYERNMQREY